jgi:peptidyl-prolyl cis-trans isomerase C
MSLFSLAFIFLQACGDESKSTSSVHTPGQLPSTGDVIATVNGKNIHQNTVDAILKQFPADRIEEFKASGGMDQMKEQLILTEVLYQEAIKLGIHKQDDIQVSLAMAERQVLAEATVQSQAEARITDDKVKAWYDEHLVQFRVSEADLAMIMISTEEDANAIKAQLDGGADFATLAKEKSEDPRTKDLGGAMGSMDLKQMPPTIKTPIESAKDGDVIGPIDLMGKFAIFKVNALNKGVKELAEVKEEIKTTLLQEEGKTYVEEMRKNAQVTEAGKATVAPATEEKPTEEKPTTGK